jgi:DNA-binding transcriptional regulator LsrR (DeoR family)
MSRTRPKSHYRGMTPEKAAEIRRRYFAREATQAELGRQYGRAQNTISRLISGLIWAETPNARN